MEPLSLYCKSYRTDLRRVQRLVASIDNFNSDNIPLYISVPASDYDVFKNGVSSKNLTLITDESIISQTSYANKVMSTIIPGSMLQQIVKSEFWRLNYSNMYLCLDSDAFFIKPFRTSDFIFDIATPYTVLDEGKEYLESCLETGNVSHIVDFQRDSALVQNSFKRYGKAYSFGPFPVVWHRAVWESLEHQFLQPNGIDLLEAIKMAPMESRWYGEALLKYKAVTLMPCQPLFKVYHYAWQFDREKRNGISESDIASLYFGIIMQSSWEREMDWPKEEGSILSKIGRRARRKLGRI